MFLCVVVGCACVLTSACLDKPLTCWDLQKSRMVAGTGDRAELVFPRFAGGVAGGLGGVCIVVGGP